MLRYLRLYLRFVEFSFGRAMEFRLDFYFRVVMDIFFYVVQIAFYRILYLHTGSVGGWNEDQMMVFIAGFLVIDGIHMTLFSNNMWWLPTLVNKGDLDYYLVRPVSSLFMLSLRDFAANSFMNLVMAFGILAWAVMRYPGHFGPGGVALFIAYLMIGNILYYTIRMLFILPVFWTHSPRGLDTVFHTVSRVMERPDRIFTGVIRRVFTFVLPLCAVASFPARLVLDPFRWWTLAQFLGVTAVFFGLTLAIWSRALRSYSSASS